MTRSNLLLTVLPPGSVPSPDFDRSERARYKVLLINPPHIQIRGLYARVVFEPLGLAYVAGALLEAGYPVEILDTIGEGFDRLSRHDETRDVVGLAFDAIRDRIAQAKPDIVGIGIPFTIRAESAYRIAGMVKAINPAIKTLVGGIHVTGHANECLGQPQIDYICMGEGERIIIELADAILRGGHEADLARIGGIGYRTADGQPHINGRESVVMDLDELPQPARHLLPYDRYFSAQKVFATGRYGQRFATVSTSRGCPYTCNFCTINILFGRKWRVRSAECVVTEIQALVRDFGVEFIHFEDDNLTLDKQRTRRIGELLIERKVKVTWDTPNGTMAHTLCDESLLRVLKQSGCKLLCFAPESGDQWAVKNVLKKNIDLSKTQLAVSICKRVGIRTEAFFVIGSVGETKTHIQNTLDFARDLRRRGLAKCHFHIATPFEGTDLYDDAKAGGFLVEAPPGCIKLEAPRIATNDFTVQDIDRFFFEASRINSRIPWSRIQLGFHLLKSDPIRLARAMKRYFIDRVSGLSGEIGLPTK